MSYQKLREEFISLCVRDGVPLETAQALLRHSTTSTRLAVARCNGTWPAEWDGARPGQLRQCSNCQCSWGKSSFRRDLCPDCRCDDLIRRACESANLPYQLSGDPRGCVVKVKLPAYKGNSWGGDGFTCVPDPEF